MWRKNRPGTGENIACEQALSRGRGEGRPRGRAAPRVPLRAREPARRLERVERLASSVAKLGLTHGRTEAGLEAPKFSLSIWFIARLFLSCVI